MPAAPAAGGLKVEDMAGQAPAAGQAAGGGLTIQGAPGMPAALSPEQAATIQKQLDQIKKNQEAQQKALDQIEKSE